VADLHQIVFDLGESDDPCQFPPEHPVTPQRYRHYRHALVLIFALEGGRGMKEGDVLRELAQDLLLTRDTDPQDAERHLEHLARVLTLLVNEGGLSLPDSTDLWRTLRQCGPGAGEAAQTDLESQSAVRPQEVAR
jgi:hypothetical protein